jgi:soluble cytochrome b562
MKKVIKLTESELIKIIKRTINEDESEYYEIPASEYKQLLVATGYNAVGLAKTRKFGGKPIKVIGDLDLSNTPIKNLGKLYVTGTLRVNGSQIENLKDVRVDGYTSYYDTPYDRHLQRVKLQKERNEADERRKEDVWNLDEDPNDTEAQMAHAAFQYLVENRDIEVLSEEEKERLEELKTLLQNKEEEQENLSTDIDDYSEKFDEIQEEIDEIEEEIGELESKNNDVYGLSPYHYDHYQLTQFKVLYDDLLNTLIAVGTTENADESLREYVESLLDDVGYSAFNDYILESNIDGDDVANYFEDMFRDDVYESPESYDIKRELSKSQEEEIWLLEMEKWVYENEGVRFPIKYPSREDNGRVFEFMDEDEEHEFQLRYEGNRWTLFKDGSVAQPGQLYDDEDTQDHEDDRDSRISDIEYYIDEIKESPEGDLDEDSVEEVVENRKYEVSRDPLQWIRDYDVDMKYFVNRDGVIDDLVSEYDYSALNSSYGSYDEININGNYYIVMKVD